MKYLLVVALAASLVLGVTSTALGVDSPMSKGSLVLGGGATFMNLSPDHDDFEESISIILFYPSVGYFLTNRLCVGTSLLLANVNYQNESLGLTAIGPQVTYYFVSGSRLNGYTGRAIPYLTCSALIGEVTNEGYELSGRAFTIGGGAAAMMAKNVGVYFEANYNFDKVSAEGEEMYKGKRFALQAGLRLFIW